jgi:hypothetical protein
MRSVGAIGCAGLIWLLSQFSASPSWAQPSEQECRIYAGAAVSQVQLATGCPGIGGLGWSADFDFHFNWCRSVSTIQMRNHEYSARQTALIGCTGRFPRVAMRDCIDYGARAWSQAALAFYKDCNFNSARWNRDALFHFNACQGQSLDITGGPSFEDEQRRISLAGCLSGPQGITPNQQAIITVHNEQRAIHCAGAPLGQPGSTTMLGWSVQLAAAAQQYAATCTPDPNDPTRFGHSSPSDRPGQGESLAWGPGLSGNGAATMWYNEVGSYNFDAPVWSGQVGHFTQMVWRTTTQIGCASATCGGDTLWVCRYTPAGNINVLAGNFNGIVVTPEQARQALIDNVPRLCLPRRPGGAGFQAAELVAGLPRAQPPAQGKPAIAGEWLIPDTNEILRILPSGSWLHPKYGEAKIRMDEDGSEFTAFYLSGATKCSYRLSFSSAGKTLNLAPTDNLQDSDHCPSGSLERVSG